MKKYGKVATDWKGTEVRVKRKRKIGNFFLFCFNLSIFFCFYFKTILWNRESMEDLPSDKNYIDENYAVFGLTYVRYLKGDLCGWVFCFITLAPIYIMVWYATMISIRRDLHIFYMLFGQMLNLIVNHILKPLLEESRPEACEREDPGMVGIFSSFMSFAFLLYFTWRFVHVCFLKGEKRREEREREEERKGKEKFVFEIYVY